LNIEIIAEPDKVYPTKPEINFSTKISCDTCYVINYLWDFGDGKSSNLAEVTPHDYGLFDQEKHKDGFVVTHYQTYEENCVDSASLIIPLGEPNLRIPNVFTPNGDGVNDTFKITLEEDNSKTILDVFWNNNLAIYNRQGKLVYSKIDYDGKIGEFDGGNLPDGVYFYVLRCFGVKDASYQGYVHIFRNSLKEE
jgi:gliding motility-associated-like protein